MHDQLAISLTLLLTLVASKLLASQGLPRASRLTLLDRYVIVSLLAVTAVSASHFVSSFASPVALLTNSSLFDDTSADSAASRWPNAEFTGGELAGALLLVLYLFAQVIFGVVLCRIRSGTMSMLGFSRRELPFSVKLYRAIFGSPKKLHERWVARLDIGLLRSGTEAKRVEQKYSDLGNYRIYEDRRSACMAVQGIDDDKRASSWEAHTTKKAKKIELLEVAARERATSNLHQRLPIRFNNLQSSPSSIRFDPDDISPTIMSGYV